MVHVLWECLACNSSFMVKLEELTLLGNRYADFEVLNSVEMY